MEETHIASLKQEQEKIQLDIINTIHEIERLKQHQKFLEKRLKLNEQETEFYEKQ